MYRTPVETVMQKHCQRKNQYRNELSIVNEVVNLENAMAYISIRGHQYLADSGILSSSN